jgi:hypothetical protein
MIIALLIAGIGFLLAGLLGVAYGIPIKEFSFGNTVIITGALTACTGMIMIALYVVVRELKAIAEHFETTAAFGGPRTAFPVPAAGSPPHDQAPGDDGLLFDQPGAAGQAGADPAAAPAVPPPWHEETASRDRSRSEAPLAEPAPAPKRRNLLFSSTSRKERERAEARGGEPAPTNSPTPPAVPPPPAKPNEPPPASFEDAWPQADRPRSVDVRRSVRTPTAPAEPGPVPGPAADRAAAPPSRREEPQAVTVLKSGVVDGMAYSLYSDGSIEAQMPEGMMRFGSIDELRAHLDQRGG